MVNVIFMFVIGLICGIGVTQIRLRFAKKKIEFYETYIHRRLEDTVPYFK